MAEEIILKNLSVQFPFKKVIFDSKLLYFYITAISCSTILNSLSTDNCKDLKKISIMETTIKVTFFQHERKKKTTENGQVVQAPRANKSAPAPPLPSPNASYSSVVITYD
jgi:hypothetical protein